MHPSYWQTGRRKRLNRRRVLGRAGLTGAAALAAALIGCGGEKRPSTTGEVASPQPGQAVATAAPADFLSSIPENPPDPFTERDIQVGGTLTRIYNRQSTLDFMVTSGTAAVAELTTPIYSKLIRLACRANMKSIMQPELEADLATQWEQPDKLTIIFTLSPNVKYQPLRPLNGRGFTIEDIKFSFNRGKTFTRSLFKGYYSKIQSVEDVGGGKVRLTLAEPYPAIQQLVGSFFMQIMPPEIGENPDVAQTTAIGTGGMMMVKNTPNVEFVFQKHPEFFKVDSIGRRKPYIDGYTLSVVTDPATQIALIESGKADMHYSAAFPITYDSVEDFAKRNPKIVLQKRPLAAPPFAFVGHHDQPPWSDVRVRQAVGLCLDRETIIQTIFRGQATIGPWFPYPYLFEKAPGLKELGPNFAYDPRRARQLLAAAGFPNGLDFDLHWYEGKDIEPIVTLFKQSAAEAGLRLNLIKAPDYSAHAQKQTAKTWTGLLMIARGVDFVDPAATVPYYLRGNPLNTGDVNDPTLVELYTKMENTLGEERKAIARQVWDHLTQNVYDVILPVGHQIFAWQPRVHNFRETSWGAMGSYGMGNMDQVWLAK